MSVVTTAAAEERAPMREPLPPDLAALAAQLVALRTMVEAALTQVHAIAGMRAARQPAPPRRNPATPVLPPVLGGPPSGDDDHGLDDLTARLPGA